jgi:hypothetical protein
MNLKQTLNPRRILNIEPVWIESIAVFIGFIFLVLSVAGSKVYYGLMVVSIFMLYVAKTLDILERIIIERRAKQILNSEGLPPMLRRQCD